MPRSEYVPVTPREVEVVPRASSAPSEAIDASGALTPRAIAVLILLRPHERTARALANALGGAALQETPLLLERGLLRDMVRADLICVVGGYRSHPAYRLAPAGQTYLRLHQLRLLP